MPSRREESKNKADHCGVQKWPSKIELQKEAIIEVLLTLTRNHVLRLAMLKKGLRKKKRNNNNNNNNNNSSSSSSSSSSKQRQKTNHRLQQVVGVTKLGNTSRNEHKYSSFCRSSKKCEKKVSLQTSTKTAHHCLC